MPCTNVVETIKEWANNYIAISTTTITETFFNHLYHQKVTYKCAKCGRRVLTTKQVIQIAKKVGKNALKQLIKAKYTNFLVVNHGLLICSKCYYERKEYFKQLERLGLEKTLFGEFRSIRLKITETPEYKRARRKAYYILEKLLKKGIFIKKQKGKPNIYYFNELKKQEFVTELSNYINKTIEQKRVERTLRKEIFHNNRKLGLTLELAQYL